MAHFNLTQCLGGSQETRYSANGRRISREEYERITARALREGHLDTFHTKARQLPGGEFRRTNYVSARW